MSTTMNEVSARLMEISARRSELHRQWMALHAIQVGVHFRGTEYEAAKARMNAIEAERKLLNEEYDRLSAEWDAELTHRSDGFFRPTGWFASALNRPLGVLPKRAMVIQPNKEALTEVKSYWPHAVATLTVAIVSLILLTSYVSWMRVSPYSLTYGAVYQLTGAPWLADLLSFVAFIWLIKKVGFTIKNYPTEGKFFDKVSMVEEQWFRMGAESWTWQQRLYSCAAFGFVHVMNFIYPVASLLVVGFVLGGAAMVVYLREHARSGDARLATLASAKFHASYNRLAVIYMVVAIAAAAGYSFLS